MTDGTVLITGASAGIGRALADEFARNGHDLLLVARREDRLRVACDDLEGGFDIAADYVVQDLADRPGREALLESVTDRQIDYLVNNVGIGTQGHFLDIDLDAELDQLELNVATPTHLTKQLGPAMRERGSGGILNVASSAAFQPGPFMAVYYATKSYLLSFSEAIHEEFKRDGVTATALCPGPVDTDFQERAGNTHTPIGSPGGFPRWLSPERVARTGYKGLMSGTAIAIPGLEYKLLWRVARVSPRPLVRTLAAQFNKP
jgi:hypothetical protein